MGACYWMVLNKTRTVSVLNNMCILCVLVQEVKDKSYLQFNSALLFVLMVRLTSDKAVRSNVPI